VTVILENRDILQACATVLAGVLIFLIIERKLDLTDIEANISAFQSAIENERKTILGLDPVINKKKIEHCQERVEGFHTALMKLEKRRSKSYKLHTYQISEDVTNLITLSLLASCIIFMILVDEQWTFYFIISRMLFVSGLIVLLIRVALRVKG
jgi:hypothetical protein